MSKKKLIGVNLLEEEVERLIKRRDELGFPTNSDYLKHLISQDQESPATLPMSRAVPVPGPEVEPPPTLSPEAQLPPPPAPTPLPPPGLKQPLRDFLKLSFWMFVGGPLVWVATRFDYTAVARKYVTGSADNSRDWRMAFSLVRQEPAANDTTLGEDLVSVARLFKTFALARFTALIARLPRRKS